MKISAELETKLDALRLEGLMRYAAMESAEKAYIDAQEREKAACQYAAEHCACKTKSGDPLTSENAMYELSEKDFAEAFVPLIAEGYKALYNLEYAVNYSPIYEQFYAPFSKAQKAYRHIAADFLHISGRTEEADAPRTDRRHRLQHERGRGPSGRQLVDAGGGGRHLPRALQRIFAHGRVSCRPVLRAFEPRADRGARGCAERRDRQRPASAQGGKRFLDAAKEVRNELYG